MRKLYPYLLFSALIISITSCSKEGSYEKPGGSTGSNGSNGGNNGGTGGSGSNTGSSNGSEVGTWKYVSMHETFTSTVEVNESGVDSKSVSTGDFITTDNGGTVTFDGSTATSSGITYSVNATMQVSTYINGTFFGSQDMPLTFTSPATSSSSTYKKIGTDSLYFAGGALVSYDATGNTVQSQAAGYKLKWDGDKMYMTLVYDLNTTQVVSGIAEKLIAHVVTVTTLQKM